MTALPLEAADPGIDRDIGNRVVVGDEFPVTKPVIEHLVEALFLATEAALRVCHGLVGVNGEVKVLSQNRAEPRHLPEQPLRHLGAAGRGIR